MQFINNYRKPSPTSMPVDEVEAWLDEFPQKRAENKPNGGIIQAAPVVVFRDRLGSEGMSKAYIKQARTKARAEFKAAKKALAAQEEADRIAIAKKIREWSSKDKKAEPLKGNKVQIRRLAMIKRLNAGKTIQCYQLTGGKSKKYYGTQRLDIVAIKDDIPEGILKLRSVQNNKSILIADRFERYEGRALSSNPANTDRGDLSKALSSGKVVESSSIKGHLYQAARAARKISREDGFDIWTVFDVNNQIKGWVSL